MADKPARSMLLNMQSSNSKFFCPLCNANTQTGYFGGRRHVYVPFSKTSIYKHLREEDFSAFAYSASSFNSPELGIKDVCFLQNFVNFDIVTSNISDYMHSVCLGVKKSLTNLLFFQNLFAPTSIVQSAKLIILQKI